MATLFIQQLVRSNSRFSLWWSNGTVESTPQLYLMDGFPSTVELGRFIPATASVTEQN
jgi:hypothetical protein